MTGKQADSHAAFAESHVSRVGILNTRTNIHQSADVFDDHRRSVVGRWQLVLGRAGRSDTTSERESSISAPVWR